MRYGNDNVITASIEPSPVFIRFLVALIKDYLVVCEYDAP